MVSKSSVDFFFSFFASTSCSFRSAASASVLSSALTSAETRSCTFLALARRPLPLTVGSIPAPIALLLESPVLLVAVEQASSAEESAPAMSERRALSTTSRSSPSVWQDLSEDGNDSPGFCSSSSSSFPNIILSREKFTTPVSSMAQRKTYASTDRGSSSIGQRVSSERVPAGKPVLGEATVSSSLHKARPLWKNQTIVGRFCEGAKPRLHSI